MLWLWFKGSCFKDCPKKHTVLQQYSQQMRDKTQKQPLPSRNSTGQFQSKTGPSRQVDWSRNKGRSGKEYGKSQPQKPKGKGKGRPGAKVMECDDLDGDENPDEEYDYPYEPDDSQGQDQDLQDDEQDDEEDYHYGGADQNSQGQPEEEGTSMVKAILSQMRKLAEEYNKVNNEKPSLSTIAVEEDVDIVKRINVLLDGGASHHVYYGPKVPEGALEREVELAHGTKIGYVKGSDITFLDESISEAQAKVPSMINLGRRIQKGIKLEWTKNGASLVLPSKKRIGIPIRNNCPYANKEVLKIVDKLRNIENEQRKVRLYFASLYSALKIRIKSQAELDQHRREGHVH